MLAMTIVAMCAACCGTKNETPKDQKTLVLYYSQTGNTKAVAEEIASRLNADIEELLLTDPYDGDFQATIERCKKEREDSTLCYIYPIASHIEDYDVIFIGYPIWFGTFAPPFVHLFLNEDFSGKKIVPFCTFGSGGLESSVKDIAAMQPNAEILPGFGIRAARMDVMPKEVEQFLICHHFIDGEPQSVGPWNEEHPVTDEETAVFDAAVDGYPMLHAKAKSVAMRAVTDGTEYLFTAVDMPREDNPDMPPAGELKVYVLAADGQAPVFTRVVR